MYAEGTVVGGRYRLVKQIGEGGMATIWEAEHQTLGSPVAVKFLQWQGPQGEQIRERFLREARVAASVRHRNVVEITDFGLTDDKTPYIVMEMLPGESLADKLHREDSLEPIEASRLVSLTLRGLAVVHEKGIVHRDLKPENIFIVDDPDGTYPKLLDVGVSRRTAEPAAKHLTQEGMIVGTPEYMSPEQARGLRNIDARTDIYSMGVILYEMLSGRLPYESENIGDLIVMITTQPPTPITHYSPHLSAYIVEIVDKAIAKDREQRYATAREMRWALIEAFRGESFGDVDSGVTGVSELPPPPPGWGGAGTGSYPLTLPATPPEGTPRDAVPGVSQPTPSAPFDRPEGVHKGPPSGRMALGAPPTPAMGLPPVPADEKPKRPRGTVVAALGVAAVALLAGAFVLYQQRVAGSDGTDEGETSVATPWKPVSVGLPAELSDAGPFGDAGETVRVLLYRLPDGGTARIEEVPLSESSADLPLAPGVYRIEVVGPDGTTLWRIDHPGYIDGEYEVWPMSASELPDAGIHPDAAEAATAEPPTKRRRPPRRGRKRGGTR